MPHVIAKIAALDEIKKISQHILKFREVLTLCPTVRILVQEPKIHTVRLFPICILNCHAAYYTIFSFSFTKEARPITRTGSTQVLKVWYVWEVLKL